MGRTRRQLLAGAAITAAAVVCGCGTSSGTSTNAADAPGARAAQAGVEATSPGHTQAQTRLRGLSAMLSMTPSHARPGTHIRLTLTATARSAPGQLGYVLRYGDGTRTSRNIVPQICLPAKGSATRRVWQLTHRYRTTGRFRVMAFIYVNCTSRHATAEATVVVV